MDTLDLRSQYADLTGDVKNAYAMREDGPEGFLYSDNTIRRALEQHGSLYDDPDTASRNQQAANQFFAEQGPRAGVLSSMAQSRLPNPTASKMRVEGLLCDARELYGVEDYGQAVRSGVRALSELVRGDRRSKAGAAMGIFDFLRNM